MTYEAYVSEQNLLLDKSKEPVKHPLIEEIFSGKKAQIILSFQLNNFNTASNLTLFIQIYDTDLY